MTNATTLPPLSETEKESGKRLRQLWVTIESEHNRWVYRSAGLAAAAIIVGFVLALLTGFEPLLWLGGLIAIGYYLYATVPVYMRKRVYDLHMRDVWTANGYARRVDHQNQWRSEELQQFLTTYAWDPDESLWLKLSAMLQIVDLDEQALIFRNEIIPAFQAKKLEAEAALKNAAGLPTS